MIVNISSHLTWIRPSVVVEIIVESVVVPIPKVIISNILFFPQIDHFAKESLIQLMKFITRSIDDINFLSNSLIKIYN